MELVFAYLCLITLAIWLSISPVGDAAPSVIWVSVGVVSSLVVVWLWITHAERKGNLFHPVMFFIFSYLIVYYQTPLTVALAVKSGYASGETVRFPEYVNFGVGVSTLGLASFMASVFSVRRLTAAFSFANSRSSAAQISTSQLRRLSHTLLVLAVASSLLFYAMVGNEFRQGVYRGTANWDSGATYPYVVFAICNACLAAVEFLRLAGIRLSSLREYIAAVDKRLVVFWLISHAPFIFAGDRGAYLPVVFYVMAPYFLLVRPLRWGGFLGGAFVAAAAMTFAGSYRTNRDDVGREERMERAIEEAKEIGVRIDRLPTGTLAWSYGCFITSIYIADMREFPRDYFHGQFSISHVLNCIPFSYRMPVLSLVPRRSTSLFLTDYMRGGDRSSGVGSTSLSGPYMDAGLPGVVSIMFLFGGILEIVCRKVETLPRRDLGAVAVFLWLLFGAIYVNRSDILGTLQHGLWVYVAMTGVKRVAAGIRSESRRRAFGW